MILNVFFCPADRTHSVIFPLFFYLTNVFLLEFPQSGKEFFHTCTLFTLSAKSFQTFGAVGDLYARCKDICCAVYQIQDIAAPWIPCLTDLFLQINSRFIRKICTHHFHCMGDLANVFVQQPFSLQGRIVFLLLQNPTAALYQPLADQPGQLRSCIFQFFCPSHSFSQRHRKFYRFENSLLQFHLCQRILQNPAHILLQPAFVVQQADTVESLTFHNRIQSFFPKVPVQNLQCFFHQNRYRGSTKCLFLAVHLQAKWLNQPGFQRNPVLILQNLFCQGYRFPV